MNQEWRQEFPDRGAKLPDGGGAKFQCSQKCQNILFMLYHIQLLRHSDSLSLSYSIVLKLSLTE